MPRCCAILLSRHESIMSMRSNQLRIFWISPMKMVAGDIPDGMRSGQKLAVLRVMFGRTSIIR